MDHVSFGLQECLRVLKLCMPDTWPQRIRIQCSGASGFNRSSGQDTGCVRRSRQTPVLLE